MTRGSHDSNKTRSTDRRKFLVLAFSAVVAGASALVIPRAGAQSAAYPNHLIKIVVPFTAGSAPDILARMFTSELPALLGQNIIVENKPGAGGSIGTAAVARAKNDGYTLCLLSTGPMAINPSLYRNLTYDPIKDLTPVIKLVNVPSLLLVPAQSPITSVQDLMQRMKERKKENSMQYNSVGTGTTLHLLGVLLAKLAGASADHVPYRGSTDQMTALATGQADFAFATLASSVSFVKSGRVRALGILSTKPSALLPDVPNLSSAGFEAFDETNSWFGVVAPKDTPEAVTQTLHRAFVNTLGNPSIQARLAAAGLNPAPPASVSEFAQFIRGQVAFWADLVKTSGASMD